MPDGGQPGTLLHRCVCPALDHVREKCMPSCIADFLRPGHNLSAAVVLALIRGLFFAPSIPHRNENRFDTFTWFKHSDDIPLGCVIFTDGSLLDGSLPKGCQSLGWAFVVIDADGELVAAAYGVPPEWVDTIQGAEL